MARLPTVDGDLDAWGTLLNAWLLFSHDDSGSIVASTARVTGLSSLQHVNVDSTLIAGEFRSTGAGSIAVVNVASEIIAGQLRSTGAGSMAVVNAASEGVFQQMVGAARWTDTTTMPHASTVLTVSAAAIQDNSEVHLTIKSPSNPNSVPAVLMVDSIVDDTSFAIVANQAVQSACPVMYSIIRS